MVAYEGTYVGLHVGIGVGFFVGALVGRNVGFAEGGGVGFFVGRSDGIREGVDGSCVGESVVSAVGAIEGDSVTTIPPIDTSLLTLLQLILWEQMKKIMYVQ